MKAWTKGGLFSLILGLILFVFLNTVGESILKASSHYDPRLCEGDVCKAPLSDVLVVSLVLILNWPAVIVLLIYPPSFNIFGSCWSCHLAFMAIISCFWWFALGALIGLIIGKIKSKK